MTLISGRTFLRAEPLNNIVYMYTLTLKLTLHISATEGLKIWDLNLSGRYAQKTIKSNENNGKKQARKKEKENEKKMQKTFHFNSTFSFFEFLQQKWQQ